MLIRNVLFLKKYVASFYSKMYFTCGQNVSVGIKQACKSVRAEEGTPAFVFHLSEHFISSLSRRFE